MNEWKKIERKKDQFKMLKTSLFLALGFGSSLITNSLIISYGRQPSRDNFLSKRLQR
jgi:hypothetical protein